MKGIMEAQTKKNRNLALYVRETAANEFMWTQAWRNFAKSEDRVIFILKDAQKHLKKHGIFEVKILAFFKFLR